ncbi:Low temperature requirement protein LtrA [Micromonospora phaseoli]|uniref:Low temperature requirement protein LtrA n=1 Tax=Micromonospora phaseoli TaxID=1144548 RepID=A0A1H7CWY1_9ACTN|nr:low temperature requirement protein A [Micromonospora phaseoli]PZV97997.1 low temperature requirement protein LtrA [Micromonospora phaseoli]SEJ94178.1 Low temperature requirement protein LtrA [Micromonospora phaseoli]
MGDSGWRGRLGPAVSIAPAARVDKFEIFFDLVFVFSFFIITRATAANINGRQLLHALLVLAVLWWCWVVHTVVATRVRIGEGFVPVLMVVGMAALFCFALALPQAFGDPQTSEAGPMVVAISYVVIRAVHLTLFLHIVRDKPAERRQLLRYAPELALSTVLLLVAALLPAHIPHTAMAEIVRDALWVTVVLLQYGTGLLAKTWGWQVTSAEHWTERYDLILIIALGESVISVGVGSNLLGQAPTWPGVTAAVFGIVFTAALWWAHYDLVGPAARIALHSTLGRRRVLMARDAYAYLYLPMIAGIIMFALGAEGIVHDVAEPGVPVTEQAAGPDVPLLFGGVFLYLAGNMLFQLRTLHTLSWLRLGTLGVLAASVPVAMLLPGLAALGLLTAICVGMIAAEVVLMSEARHALRAVVLEERTAYEAYEAQYRARWHGMPPGTT